jgi:hypothetical protein
MKRMSKAEIEKFEADEKADSERTIKRMRAARFYAVNVDRQQHGLPPLTEAQFEERERKAYQLERERMAQLQHEHKARMAKVEP